MQTIHKSERGRNMLEMIAVLAIILLLLLSGLWGFKKASVSARVGTISKDVSTAVTERRYQIAQGGLSQQHKRSAKVGSTDMTIENIISGVDKGSFSVLLSSQSKDICEEMKKYAVFAPKKIEIINGSTENDCADTNNIKFYFDGYDRGHGGGHGSGSSGGHSGSGTGGTGGSGGTGGGTGGTGGSGDTGGTGSSGGGDDPLKSGCDDVIVVNSCCSNEYDSRTRCLTKRYKKCPDTHQCSSDCQCEPYTECPTGYSEEKCYPGQTDKTLTLVNGKECHKCEGTPITQCYATHTEGGCPKTKIIKEHLILKNTKECYLCEECPENEVPNANQTECEKCPEGKKPVNGVCVECDTTATCPTCPTDKPYWDGDKCVQCMAANGFVWDDVNQKCTCLETYHEDNGICCPYSQVNYNGTCTCENPNNKCGTACCNGQGEKCYDATNGICCTKPLCGGECCATNAQCIEGKCVNPCGEGKKLVDYYNKSGVKLQTCCPENSYGADWSGTCCGAGMVGAFGHNHNWVYISRCCPKEGQEDKGMVGLRGLAETYSCAPPDTTMDASATAGAGGTGHTWYVPKGSKNVQGDGWACAPETTRGGVLHATCGHGNVCQHGWKRNTAYRRVACTYCYGEWDENDICRLPDCTKPREHIAYCYCNPENGSYLEYNYYTGGTWGSGYVNDVCVTPKKGNKTKCTQGLTFYNTTYGCMSCETYIPSGYASTKEACLNCYNSIWKNNRCSLCPAGEQPNATFDACEAET